MKIIVASLVRNEGDRFWRSALEAWSEFADEIICIDDNSTDNTAAIARDEFDATCFPRHRPFRDGDLQDLSAAWGNEAPAREELWDLVVDKASEGDIIFFLDADMVPAKDPRELFKHSSADVFSFALYDLWESDPLRYRSDRFWRAHLVPRVWAVRVGEDFADREWEWSERGIHSGHLPLDLAHPDLRIAFAPQDHSLLHYGYIDLLLRSEKAVRYASVSDQLTTEELQHAASITDSDPALLALPFDPEYTLHLQTS